METPEITNDTVQLSEIEQITKLIEYPQTSTEDSEPLAEELLLPSQVVEDETDEDEISDLEQTSDTPSKYSELSKEELVEKLKELAAQGIDIARNEIDGIKQSFYKKVKITTDELREKFVEAGNAIEDFIPQKDEVEETFKNILNEIKAKRAETAARAEKQREQNLLEKQHIISQMKMLVEKNDDVSGAMNDFRDLQQKWKTIGAVPATVASQLWREYSQCQEAFWDLVKINNELREYDFKKNLETKNALIEAADKLAGEKDVVLAFKKLQKLHEEWREIGPVARDLREEIWNRFRAVSAVVNKNHQDFFEKLRKNEEENANAKTALCEKIESIDTAQLKSFNAWEETSKQVLECQEQWRKLGFAPRKINQKLFDRYRKACDAFFADKTVFFKEIRSEFSTNIEKKTLLCKKAEELKESTDWRETSAAFVEMQKEWKSIGTVPRKFSEPLWKRFSDACNYFFEQKKNATSELSSGEKDNLKKKLNLIERIKNIDTTQQADSLKALKEMIVEWNATGFVPYKEKEKTYREYRAAVDKAFDALNVDANARRLDSFRSNLEDMVGKGEGKLTDEYKRLTRAYEKMKMELNTCENNLGFFTSSSKKGGGLIEQMNKNIDKLKNECKLLEQKIKLLQKEIK